MGKNSKIQNFYKEFCFKCGCFNKKIHISSLYCLKIFGFSSYTG